MADATAALEQYRATEKSLSYLSEAFSYTGQKFSLGLLTSMEYNIAKNKLAKAQSDLLQAKYNYIFNSRILDFYRGIPIELR
jgi:outer membrane protein